MGVPEDKSCGVSMPVRAVPYRHQRDAFLFACGMFGILPEKRKIESQGVALLMEMGTGKTRYGKDTAGSGGGSPFYP